jgi:hypothetical protein
MRKQADIKRMKRLIERCLDDGFHLDLFLPYEELRNPTWDELRAYAMEAYAAALEDILNAIDGRYDHLEEAASDDGRTIVKYGDEDLYIEYLEELREQLTASMDEAKKKNLER